MSELVFVGLDLGTGGARALAVTESGALCGAGRAELGPHAVRAGGQRHEQEAENWWAAAQAALGALGDELEASGHEVAGIAVDATSGSFVPVDAEGTPVRMGLMYDDGRAAEDAEALRAASAEHRRRHGFGVSGSFALAKMRWLARNEPHVVERAALFAHQADFVVGRLTGVRGVSDLSNALKSGCDLFAGDWPDWVRAIPAVAERLPRLVAPATRVGALDADVAERVGLPAGVPVVAGATDGTAGFLASGARRPGELNTSLGTTLIFKMLDDACVTSADGAVYSHRLGEALWLPGAASNAGAGALEADDPAAADAAAAPRLPTASIAYPLVRRGERFPLPADEAEAFCDPPAPDPAERHAALLQGVAMVERLGCERLEAAAGRSVPAVYATGAASRSDVWLQLRADTLGRPVHRPASGEAALGAAILAAAGTRFASIPEAAGAMTRIEATFEPAAERGRALAALYARFLETLAERPDWPDPRQLERGAREDAR